MACCGVATLIEYMQHHKRLQHYKAWSYPVLFLSAKLKKNCAFTAVVRCVWKQFETTTYLPKKSSCIRFGREWISRTIRIGLLDKRPLIVDDSLSWWWSTSSPTHPGSVTRSPKKTSNTAIMEQSLTLLSAQVHFLVSKEIDLFMLQIVELENRTRS